MTLRPESSVTCVLNVYGDLEFPNDAPGPVIHRTPEELGIPRVVPDVPVPKRLSVWLDKRDTGKCESERRPGVRKDRPAQRAQAILRPQTIQRPQAVCVVKTPATAKEAEAAPGAEDEEKAMGRTKRTDGVQYAAKGCVHQAYDGKRYCTSKHFYWNKRADAALPARTTPRDAQLARPRAVEVDPQRPGTASALLGALEKMDAAESSAIRVELSGEEVGQIFAKMSGPQKAAFLGAGLRAALLA